MGEYDARSSPFGAMTDPLKALRDPAAFKSTMRPFPANPDRPANPGSPPPTGDRGPSWPPDPSGPGPGVGGPGPGGGFLPPDLSKIIPLLGAGKPPGPNRPPPNIPLMGTFNQAPGGMSPAAQAVSAPTTTSSPSSRAGSGRRNPLIPVGQQNNRGGQSGAARNPLISYDPMTDPSRPPPDPAPIGFEWYWDESSFRWAQRATTSGDGGGNDLIPVRPPKPDPIPGYEWYWNPVGGPDGTGEWTRMISDNQNLIPPPKPDPIEGYEWYLDPMTNEWIRKIPSGQNLLPTGGSTQPPTPPVPPTPGGGGNTSGTTDPFQGFTGL